MDAAERLKGAMVRVKALVGFYQEHLTTIIFGTVDLPTEVIIEDLKVLLEGLADRDISIKRPEFVSQREIERDIRLAKEIVDERESWTKGYNKGYQAGRDGEIAWRKMQIDD